MDHFVITDCDQFFDKNPGAFLALNLLGVSIANIEYNYAGQIVEREIKKTKLTLNDANNSDSIFFKIMFINLFKLVSKLNFTINFF